MAFDTGISSAVAQYVYTQSSGAVTEPVGGSYIQAYCEYLGITEPLYNSWLIALCDYFGITEPVNGSWTIALANYYSITYPTGGTWWMALALEGVTPVTELIWNTTSSFWNQTDVDWATDTIAPDAPVWSGQTFPAGVFTPTITGTAEPLSTITLTADAQVYTGQTDALGDWSVQITNPLIPGPEPTGQSYLVSVTATDVAGNVSPAADDTIYILESNEVTLTLNMYDTYGDGWNSGYFELERETSPDVWEPIEYNENPFRFNTLQQLTDWESSGATVGQFFYKTDPMFGVLSGIYGLRFERYEPGGLPGGGSTGWKQMLGARTWTVPNTGNYRTVAKNLGSYPTERSYSIYNGATEIIAVAGATWTPDTVQSTFTL